MEAERPCPHVGCKHHLLLDVSETEGLRGAVSTGRPGRRRQVSPSPELLDSWTDGAVETLMQREDTCALDLADQGGCEWEEIAQAMGCSERRAKQIGEDAIAKIMIRARYDGDVQEWVRLWAGRAHGMTKVVEMTKTKVAMMQRLARVVDRG